VDTSSPPPDVAKQMTTTVTDLDDIRARLTSWLSARTGGGPVELGTLNRPSESGMSSVSILFDASWTEGGHTDGERVHAELVARIPPDNTAFPVFPSYDLERQAAVMAAVGAHTHAPVPRLYWYEASPEALGSPFIVMERVDGRIPVDNPPYVFGGWLLEAPPDEQRELQDTSVATLAAIHALPDATAAFPEMAREAGVDPLRSLVDAQRAYYEWTRREDGLRIPVIEETFDWLEAHWPADPGETVLCWGDARPGNMIYEGFRPVAVLDWEMCTLGPREVDLAWMYFLHRFFQDIAEVFELPGLPEIFRRDDMIAVYEKASGHTVHDFEFFVVYAALRHAVVMSQVKRRMIHFGEDTEPATPDEYVMFHAMLRGIIEGTYDWTGK
jgi:aminoglycoside phosphotransferase (APT) family kinase protein